MSAESSRVFLVSYCLLISPLGQSPALTIALHAYQFTSLLKKKKSIKFPSKRNYRHEWEDNLFHKSFTLPWIVFQMIPAGFLSSYTTSMSPFHELGFTSQCHCHATKNTPLTGSSSALWFFLETTFFEKKKENKILFNRTVYKPKENRTWFVLPQKDFRSGKLCIRLNQSGQLWDVKMT